MKKAILFIFIIFILSFSNFFMLFISSLHGTLDSARIQGVARTYSTFAKDHNLVPTDKKFCGKTIKENFQLFIDMHNQSIKGSESLLIPPLIITLLLFILFITLIKIEINKKSANQKRERK